jgi:hypothetical protein
MAEMTRGLLCGLRLLAAAAGLAGPLAGQTSVSIYGDGRAVVRRTLPQPLVPGRNTVTLRGAMAEGADLATLFSPDPAVAVASATLLPASDRAAALGAALGQTLSFVRGKGDTLRATVVRVAPPQYRLADGRLLLAEPGEPLVPAELVRAAPEVTVVVEAARARPRTELAYVMGEGARWQATYQVVLDGAGRAAVSGAATISALGLRADSAEVQLVAGAINRARGGPGPRPEFALTAEERARAAAAAAEEAVGETHVYQLPGRWSLEPGRPVAVALFPRTAAPYTRELVVPGALPWRGGLGSAAEPNRVPVEVWYTVTRARGTPFGDQPLPAGTVQLYQPDASGRVELLGEAASEHTAPGRDLRVQAGLAFDVTAERVQTDYAQEPLPPARRGMAPRQRITASYRVTIANAKPEAVTVDVREARAGVWRVTASSVPAEKLSATEVRFRVPVPANGEATLTYTVQAEQ